MKNIAYIYLIAFTLLFACNSEKKENIIVKSIPPKITETTQENDEKIIYDDRRESLKLFIKDTIKSSKSYFFSNTKTKDLFQLTIMPGLVKNSKSELQIKNAENKVIYSQTFDSFYFIREIYDPETTPTTGGQKAYEEYVANYWKTLTPKQFENFFNKNVKDFFGHISFFEKEDYKDILSTEEIINDDFLQEVKADSTILLINVTCFDCDEGGMAMGYSQKQKKVVTVSEHD
jgi:hypothetical protein